MHTFWEIGGTVFAVLLGVLGATWHLGNKIGIIETKIDSLDDDLHLIRTNDLYHIERRFENIERVLMEEKRDDR